MAPWYLFTLISVIVLHWCSELVAINGDRLTRRSIEETAVVFRKLKQTFLQLGKKDTSKLDIVFVLDKSCIGGIRGFDAAKRFLSELLEYFPVFPSKTRVALVSYSTILKLEFNFGKNSNKECARKEIEKIRYIGGATATGYTLEWIRNRLIFNSEEGARSNAKKVIFLLTNGKSDRGVAPSIPADRLKGRGVIMFGLGMTEKVARSELLSTASSPSHVFKLRNSSALNSVVALLKRDISQNCLCGQLVFDQCGRRCRCNRGKLVECCRLRKEFTNMTFTERRRYINAVKTASTHPTYRQRYEDLITSHKVYFFSNIHQINTFLPWHRWFVLQYENLLREIDCCITVPYWDWSLVAASPFSSDMWNSGAHGFGGNGSGVPYCVRTGPFRVGVWSLVQSAGGGCLTRNSFGRTPDAIAVRSLIMEYSPAEFVKFEFLLRIQFHDSIHCTIGGIMCSEDSAAAPEFFLHHGFVDKIWWDWQKQSDAHKFTPFFARQTVLMPATPFLPRDFLNLKNMPSCTCTEYVPPTNVMYEWIRGLSSSEIRQIPRLTLPVIDKKVVELFRYKPEVIQRLNKLKEEVSPRRMLNQSALHGNDAIHGFRLADVTDAESSSDEE